MLLTPEQIAEMDSIYQDVKGSLPEPKARQESISNRSAEIRNIAEMAQRKNSVPSKIDRALVKTGDFVNKIFPGEKVGEAIGTLAMSGIRRLQGREEEAQTIEESAPSPMQVIGDVASGAATVAGLKGVGATGSAASKALKSAGIGATIFGGEEMAEGGSAEDVAKSAAVGGAVGGATSLAFSGGEAVLKQFKGLPSRLINSATGQSKKEILANKGLDKFILENKKIGTAEGLIKSSKDEMDRLSEIINNNLKSIPVTKAKITTSALLDDIVKDINEQGGAITKTEAREIINRLAPQAKGLLQKPSMSLVTANKLRQSIDRTIGDKGFLAAELPFNKDLLRSFANALREEVKTKAPEGTRAAFNALSNEIRLSSTLANKIAQGSRNQIISFGDLIGGTIGGATGGIPGAIAGAGIRRAVQSTPFLTGSAVAVDKLNKTLGPILTQIEPSLRTSIVKAISEAVTSKEPQQE